MKKGIVFFMIWISLLLFAFSQSEQWAKAYGGLNLDFLDHIVKTTQGGFIVAGHFYDDPLWNFNTYLCIFELSPEGTILRHKIFTNPGNLSGNAYVKFHQLLLKDDGYIAVGRMRTAPWTTSLFIVKFSSDLNIIWSRIYGTEKDHSDEFNTLRHVSPSFENDLLTAGTSFSFGAGKSDAWVVLMDAEGNIQTQTAYGGTGYDEAVFIHQTEDGNFLVAGNTSSYGEGGGDAWIFKLSPEGDILWNRTYGGDRLDAVHGASPTADGLLLVGESYSPHERADSDVWVFAVGNEGNLLWSRIYGNDGNDKAEGVGAADDGGFYLTGSFQEDGNTDLLLLKLYPNGDVQWQKGFGSRDETQNPSKDIGRAVLPLLDGALFGGETSSMGIHQDDMFLVRVDQNGNMENCGNLRSASLSVFDWIPVVHDVVPVITVTTAVLKEVEISPSDFTLEEKWICPMDKKFKPDR